MKKLAIFVCAVIIIFIALYSSILYKKNIYSYGLPPKDDQSKKSGSITYEKNNTVLSYDELMLWAGAMAVHMASQQRKTTRENKDKTIFADYGHAKILWSGREASKIYKLEIIEPNLACPRGVFVGNPVEKIKAYYKSLPGEDFSGQKRIYFEESKSGEAEKYAYGFYEKDSAVYGAAEEISDGTFNCLKLTFKLKNGKVSGITYQADYGVAKNKAVVLLNSYRKMT